jgi:hypothetical protein
MADPQLQRLERLLKYRRVATAVMAVCALWIVGGLAYGLAVDNRLLREVVGKEWIPTWVYGSLISLMGLVLSWGTRSSLKAVPYEVRWHRDKRRGTVGVSALRPGPSQATLTMGLDLVVTGMQQLTCSLDVRVAGLPERRADYIGAVGPLDAAKFVDGATLACEANPSMPERLRIWPHVDPKGGELTGSALDFSSARP